MHDHAQRNKTDESRRKEPMIYEYEEYKDEEKIVKIRANIMVSRTSQKSIVIGHQGKKIKKLGTEARIDIESFISKKVYLDLFVKVDKDWRDKEGKLKKYGY